MGVTKFVDSAKDKKTTVQSLAKRHSLKVSENCFFLRCSGLSWFLQISVKLSLTTSYNINHPFIILARRFCRDIFHDDMALYTLCCMPYLYISQVTCDFVDIKYSACTCVRQMTSSVKHCLWWSSRLRRTVVTFVTFVFSLMHFPQMAKKTNNINAAYIDNNIMNN